MQLPREDNGQFTGLQVDESLTGDRRAKPKVVRLVKWLTQRQRQPQNPGANHFSPFQDKMDIQILAMKLRLLVGQQFGFPFNDVKEHLFTLHLIVADR